MKPDIYNVTMTVKDTEYSQSLPSGCRKVLIKERSGGASVKLAYAEGESGTEYITIAAGQAKYLEMAGLENLTLYFQCSADNKVLEIETFS